MGKEYYDRYQKFKSDGKYIPLPFIPIPPKSSDKSVVYNADRTRLDKLSQKYYDNPFHGWLILSANPQYGGVEENIPDKEIIRIPFPFRDSIQQYISEVDKYTKLYLES
jgi:hypothetical protein